LNRLRSCEYLAILALFDSNRLNLLGAIIEPSAAIVASNLIPVARWDHRISGDLFEYRTISTEIIDTAFDMQSLIFGVFRLAIDEAEHAISGYVDADL
jgi:hypothetical protein